MAEEYTISKEAVEQIYAKLDEIKVKAAELFKPRVCRGCKWLRGSRCRALGLFGENVLYVDTEREGKHRPLIHRPDDFGCNKWEAKS